MGTKHLSWSTSEIKVRLVPWSYFKPSFKKYWPFQSGAYFVDPFCYLCFMSVMLSRLFIATLWSPAGKGLTSWLLFVMFSCVFLWILFCYLCFMSVVLSCLFIAALWSPAEKANLLALVCNIFLCFLHFPMWCPGSGEILDCIDSWSLPSSFVASLYVTHFIKW